MPSQRKVLVLGAGVSGLTTASVLQDLGIDVTIWAREFGDQTTSHIAPAIWYPEKLQPEELTRKWATLSIEKFYALAMQSESGVILSPIAKYFHRRMGDPWWKEIVRDFKRIPESELRGAVCGYEFTGVVIDTSIYFDKYLFNEFKRKGGACERKILQDFEGAFQSYEAIINCAGLGARELFADSELSSIRGQIVRIAQISTSKVILDTDHPQGMISIIPRNHDCILGSTSQKGNDDRQIDSFTSNEIIERCGLYFPEIKTAAVLDSSVGFRPFRSSVRVESEPFPNGRVLLHNYGHAGNGYTLSWGCAFDVAERFENFSNAVRQGRNS